MINILKIFMFICFPNIRSTETNLRTISNLKISNVLEIMLNDINSKFGSEMKSKEFDKIVNSEDKDVLGYKKKQIPIKNTQTYKFLWEGYKFIQINQFIIPTTLLIRLLLNDVINFLVQDDSELKIQKYLEWRLPNHSKSLRDKILMKNFYKTRFKEIQTSIIYFDVVYDDFCEFKLPSKQDYLGFDFLVNIFYDTLKFDYNSGIEQITFLKNIFCFVSEIEIKVIENCDSKTFLLSEFQVVFLKHFFDRSIEIYYKLN